MAFRPDYLLRETSQNLFRNPSLSIASILTVAVSLSLLGASLLIQSGVGDVVGSVRDGVEFNVWMTVDVEDDQIEAVETFLDGSPFVRNFTYVDSEASYQEFQSYFADTPDVLDLISPDEIPTSFLVTPNDVDVVSIHAIGEEIENYAGVREVNFASDYITVISGVASSSSIIMLVVALVAAVGAALLMYNSIRTAVFARRREIEVMRLVGATKWFIRIPFMFEGLMQGLIGACLSVFSVFALNELLKNFIEKNNFNVFQDFPQGNGSILQIGFWLLLVGAALGFFGAGVAVTRYLDA